MSGVDVFINHAAEWMRGEGPENDIVVSSRLRIARNLEGYPFHLRISEAEQTEVLGLMEKAVSASKLLKKAHFFNFMQLAEIDRQFLLERHLISRELAAEKGNRAVAVTPDELVSLMILEEDHLRLQAFQPGFNLTEAWRIVSLIDDELEAQLKFSFHQELGYLTACPTNVGTGLRASCMLHLPSLVLTKQVHKVLQALSKLNLAARGLYGEGTQALGNFFQFSNQMTLGQTEDEIIDNLAAVIRQVIEHEREAREHLRVKKKTKFEDQIWRGLGTLKSARMMSSAESTQLLSLVHLGMCMGLIQGKLNRKDIQNLFVLIQPAHLQKISGSILSSQERDSRRADLLREKLKDLNL